MHDAQLEPNGNALLERRRVLLSALWVFVMLNYLYADVMSLMDPVLLPQWLAGKVEGITITRPFLFAAAVMMEVPIAMTVLSRVLPQRSNCIANMAAGIFKTLALTLSLFVGKPNAHYLFFALVEIPTTTAIVIIAYRWPKARDAAIRTPSGGARPKPGP
jgi:uncharacterized membrane protein (DUF485 family)